MEKPQPQKEHQWLHRIVGEWRAEFEMSMGPDVPVEKAEGTATIRSLGDLWILVEGESMGDNSIMTLGYDEAKGRFVGTFIASMMTSLWIYEGQLDAEGKTLKLDTEGPNFENPGVVEPYQDQIVILSDDHYQLKSYLKKDGEWFLFMEANYHRV